jgi:hypothetical protein
MMCLNRSVALLVRVESVSRLILSARLWRVSAAQVRFSEDVNFSSSRGTGFQRFQPVREWMIPRLS